jgi:hypothetical protein
LVGAAIDATEQAVDEQRSRRGASAQAQSEREARFAARDSKLDEAAGNLAEEAVEQADADATFNDANNVRPAYSDSADATTAAAAADAIASANAGFGHEGGAQADSADDAFAEKNPKHAGL